MDLDQKAEIQILPAGELDHALREVPARLADGGTGVDDPLRGTRSHNVCKGEGRGIYRAARTVQFPVARRLQQHARHLLVEQEQETLALDLGRCTANLRRSPP